MMLSVSLRRWDRAGEPQAAREWVVEGPEDAARDVSEWLRLELGRLGPGGQVEVDVRALVGHSLGDRETTKRTEDR